MKLKQYIPSFCEQFIPVELDVSTKEELLNDRVMKWCSENLENFYRFSIRKCLYSCSEKSDIVAEYENGKKFDTLYIIENMSDDEKNWFPEWEPEIPYKKYYDRIRIVYGPNIVVELGNTDVYLEIPTDEIRKQTEKMVRDYAIANNIRRDKICIFSVPQEVTEDNATSSI